MTTVVAPLDFVTLEANAEAAIAQAEEEAQGLSLEALAGDTAAMEDLAHVERELDDRKLALVRLRAARAEQGKRDPRPGQS